MFRDQRWMVVATGIFMLVLSCSSSHAQEYAAPHQPAMGGPTVIVNGVAQPMPAGVVIEGAGPPGGPTGPSAGPGPGSGGPGKPGEGPKPGEAKKSNPDSPEKKEGGKDEKKEGGEQKPKEAEGPTKRPLDPPEPPDPAVLKIRPDEQGKVSFSFKGHSWPSVMEWIADISAMSLDWQELPPGYLNLITQQKFSVAEARDLINRHLLARGYTMLIQDGVLSVFKTDSINTGMVPRVDPEELANRPPYDFVKVSFPLDWLLATEAAEELKPMMSTNGKLTPLEATNRLEAMDAVINLRQVYQVLQQEQSDSGQERLVREFVLKHTSAKQVVEHLNTLLGIETKKGPPGPMTPQQMEEMNRQAQMQAEMAKNAGKNAAPPKKKAEIYLLANERKNSVVVNAPPDKMAVIAQSVQILDVSSIPEESIVANINRIQVYRLENVEPQAVVKMIQEMGTLDHTSHLEVDSENNAIIASATLVDHVTIRTLVERLDRGGRRSVILPLEDLRAEMVVKQISFLMGGAEEAGQDNQRRNADRGGFNPFDPFERSFSRSRGPQSSQREDKFRVSADVKNNALILWCNEFELRKVEDLIEQLQAVPDSGGGAFEVRVYRLNTLDPEPLVSTLEDMDALGVHASLKADKESRSIVAYATAADHQKIQDLIDRLDASGRKFEVVQLRRLQADYVAGTIEFMMGAAEEKQQSSSRYYFDYFPMDRQKKDDKSGFKIDADVENNRLLLLANEAEMAEVMNLLVKLGEIPAEGGDPSTVRVIDTLPGPELENLLRQIEKAWPSLAPGNPLLLPDKDDETKQKRAEPAPGSDKKDIRPSTARGTPPSPYFHFAQHHSPGEVPAAAESAAAGAAPAKPAAEQLDPPGRNEPADTPPLDAVKTTTAGKAPVSITVGPDGRLVITSEDTQALDRLEKLLSNLAPPRPDYEIFRLRYAYASTVALNLEDVFKDKKDETSGRGRTYYFYDYYGSDSNKKEDEKFRLSKRKPLKFISDYSSNSILVQNADPGQLKVIGELIEFYDQPEPSDSQSVRKTEVVAIKFSKASVIAETVKDVYRDLLSANDKALANNQQKNNPERAFTYVYDVGDGGDSSDEERKTPSFKGLLSLGVDDLSNTLIVSAPAYFITDVLKVIENLDQAAEPTTETVEVVALEKGVSASELQKALMRILQERSAGKPKENGKKPEPNRPGPGPGPEGPGPR